MRSTTTAALALCLITACSAATRVDDDAGTLDADTLDVEALDADTFDAEALDADTPDADTVEDAGCHFTYEDSERGPFECVVPSSSDETCRDAGLCFCNAVHPEGSEEEIEACMVEAILPRAMVTLSDYCWSGVPMSLAEALSRWAADRGAFIVTDEACDDMPATLGWP